MFETLEQYEKYLADKPLDTLLDIEENIDRHRFPERYELVLKYIEIKKNKLHTYKSEHGEKVKPASSLIDTILGDWSRPASSSKKESNPYKIKEEDPFLSGCAWQIVGIIIGVVVLGRFDFPWMDTFHHYFEYVYRGFFIVMLGIVVLSFRPANKFSRLMRRRKYQEAIDICLERISKGTVNKTIYKTLARCYTMLGHNSNAISQYQTALSLGLEDAEIYIRLAVLMAERKHFDTAHDYIEKSKDWKKKRWYFSIPRFMISEARAWIHYLSGDTDKMFRHYKKAREGYLRRGYFLRHTEDMSPIYYRFGKMSLFIDNYSGAEKFFKWSIKSSPNSTFAEKSKTELDKLKKHSVI